MKLLHLRTLLFGSGITLSSATSLRFTESIPVGPGEMALLLWMFWTSLHVLRNTEATISRSAFLMILAINFYLIAILIGTVVNVLYYDALLSTFDQIIWLRNLVPIFFSSAIALFFILDRVNSRAYIHAIKYSYIAYIVASVSLLWIGFEVSYGGVRFSALSENPNQFALLIIMGTFICLFDMKTSLERCISFLGIILSLYSAFMSQSDALALALPLGLGFHLYYTIQLKVNNWRARSILSAFLLLFLASVSVTQTGNILTNVQRVSNDQGGQGGVRTSLWKHGIQAGNISPIFGFGPGAYSGYHNYFGEEEAHNNIIDSYTVGGMVAVTAILFILLSGMHHALKIKSPALVSLTIAMFLFSNFHYLMRQPIFWTSLILPLTVSRASKHLVRSARKEENYVWN